MPFPRLLGKPPVMVAGMNPSTVKAGFVNAILSDGYHIKLAGGHYNAAAVRAKVVEIQSSILPGVGITLNSLYINPRQFDFQFPLWQEMKREGLPFCVAGIKHMAFKPGSVKGIRHVVATRTTPLSCNGPAAVRVDITRMKISASPSPTLPFGPSLTSRSLLALLW